MKFRLHIHYTDSSPVSLLFNSYAELRVYLDCRLDCKNNAQQVSSITIWPVEA